MYNSSLRRLATVVVAAMWLIAGFCLAFAEGTPLAPLVRLEFIPRLSDADEADNISGAACAIANEGRYSCLMVGDEVRYARLFALSKDGLTSGKEVFLLPKRNTDSQEGEKYNETDAEGIAFSSGAYYLVGSHGLNKSGKRQPSRYFLYRMKIDESTGLVSDLGSENVASTQIERTGNLGAIIAKTPQLARYTELIPDRQGINIEGIAIKDGQLYVGFRGPLLGGGATIASIKLDAVFENSSAELNILPPISIGDGQGVRDLASVDGGLLILTGPQRDQTGAADVCFWKIGEATANCRRLIKAGGEDSKPEAITLLETTTEQFKILIMSDGSNGGAPAIYDFPRASSP